MGIFLALAGGWRPESESDAATLTDVVLQPRNPITTEPPIFRTMTALSGSLEGPIRVGPCALTLNVRRILRPGLITDSMFGTLRYMTDSQDGEFLQHEIGTGNNGPIPRPQNLACDNCRVKKASLLRIRCNGRRSGCSRCDTLGVSCIYSEPATRKSRKRTLTPTYGAGENASASEEPRRTPVQDPNGPERPQLDRLSSNPENIDPRLTQLGSDNKSNAPDRLYLNSFDWHMGDGGAQAVSAHMESRLEPDASLPDADAPLLVGPKSYTDDSMALMMHAPSLLSPAETHSDAQRDPHHQDTRSTCSCLATAVFLLDEFEAYSSDSNDRLLDSSLSSHREVLSWCKRMLRCAQCRGRPENMTVFNLVLERLVSLGDSMVDAYFELANDSSPSSHSTSTSSSVVGQRSRFPSRSSPPLPPLDFVGRLGLYLGDYEMGGREWKALVRVLVFMQIGALDSFFVQLKRLPFLAQRSSHMVRLLTSEQRNARIARRLWPELPEGTSVSESGPYVMLGLCPL
ncbi:hypothetical protein FE257_004524 [Aspergillus nanangensis]|uniref:Zn(2)-C6 fungal-type domain-containing protein n=1 Tax=Aspergillus nanangensis TaxID=2582783 RepID=A0AAD4D046_ASPNN|nr:hypothetical protein FE257_004524 [Aspergillus nanangensis]